jgi:hypothetical protein
MGSCLALDLQRLQSKSLRQGIGELWFYNIETAIDTICCVVSHLDPQYSLQT